MRRLPLIAVVSLVAAAFAAGPVGAQAMRAAPGEATAPPLGFLDLCARSPGDCSNDPAATPQQLADLARAAGQARWRRIFDRSGSAAVAAPSVTAPSVGSAKIGKPKPSALVSKPARPQKVRPDPVLEAALAWRPAVATAAAASLRTSEDAGPQPVLTDRPLSAISRVNRRINRAIARGDDAAVFGVADYWAAPSEGRGRGDCEDYVLAKRRALIEDGVPAAALSIALVETRGGESHAVLLVATPQGEMVLDNLTPWVLPRDRAPYRWVSRQAPGEPMRWVAPVAGAPASV